MPQPVILIPVNRLDRAKGRLAAVLTHRQREQLTVATLTTVWQAANHASDRVIILTADRRVAVILGPGENVMPESAGLHGLNAQLTHATAEVLRTDPGRPLLILHADLPLASAEAIQRLVAAAVTPPSITIVRSTDGGTNAMLQSHPGRIALAYGPDSAAKHETNARSAGLSFAIHHSPELELDLDTPADLTTLFNTPAGDDTLAGKALAAMDIRSKLGSAP